jgi:hypothetical protein
VQAGMEEVRVEAQVEHSLRRRRGEESNPCCWISMWAFEALISQVREDTPAVKGNNT